MDYYIGIDIGGTKCSCVLGDENVNILSKKVFDTGNNTNPYIILERFKQNIDNILLENNLNIKAIGISCGGPLDSKNGVILSPPNLPLWDNVKITSYFNNIYNIPVYLQNDANACAIAEWMFGAGKGTNNMLFLTFGTGLGMGIILDGKLYSGTNDMAGEVGHIRLSKDGPIGYGKSGSFEGFCSGGGIQKLAKIINPEIKEDLTTRDICKLAENGDATCLKIIEQSAEKLGYGLSIIIDILNPEMIVIGSIFQRAEHLFRTKMEEVIKKEALPHNFKVCKIVPAKLNDSIGDIAALSIAINNTRNNKLITLKNFL